MGTQDFLILFFVKYPEPGQVKTRLSQDLGPDTASEIYNCFVLDMLDLLKQNRFPFAICYYPEAKGGKFIDWLGKGLRYIPQRGDDLGARMKNAFEQAFKLGCGQAVLIGSDFPDISFAIIEEAFEALRRHGVAIGPAVDGGYYLIGFREGDFFPKIFQNMAWGSSTVFKSTLSLLNENREDVYVLPAWRDVDTLDDVRSLLHRSQGTDFASSKTINYLTKLEFDHSTLFCK